VQRLSTKLRERVAQLWNHTCSQTLSGTAATQKQQRGVIIITIIMIIIVIIIVVMTIVEAGARHRWRQTTRRKIPSA